MQRRCYLTVVIFLFFVVSVAQSADVSKGKALFNNPKFAGGTSGKSCNTCHPNGKGLENVAKKKEITIMGKKHKTVEEAVNTCIVMALKGKAIDEKSKDMADIVAYIKSLKGNKKSDY